MICPHCNYVFVVDDSLMDARSRLGYHKPGCGWVASIICPRCLLYIEHMKDYNIRPYKKPNKLSPEQVDELVQATLDLLSGKVSENALDTIRKAHPNTRPIK